MGLIWDDIRGFEDFEKFLVKFKVYLVFIDWEFVYVVFEFLDEMVNEIWEFEFEDDLEVLY